ncbi:GL10998 [Drosophila persimilis]|uniref:GL10998 n=1 Tax=Drosophila persimilis TaxID=7234 RepID=B4HA85_DROPE|nr:GL10998 [Drosophila persimilis]
MLQRCNPHLPTSDWKVVKVETSHGPTNKTVVVFNKDSLAPIEAAKGELHFGLSSVTIKVYTSDVAQAAPLVPPAIESRPTKPPPIVLPKVSNIAATLKEISQLIPVENFYMKTNPAGGLRIMCIDVNSYRTLQSHFRND